jgi:class 3 adenylate cyclase
LPAVAPAGRVLEQTSQAYTPAHLAEKILTARPALAGERKQVTVLFADLKDSTELIRGLDPEAAQQLLDPAIHGMMEAVHRFEGTVNQVLGDGIMPQRTRLPFISPSRSRISSSRVPSGSRK